MPTIIRVGQFRLYFWSREPSRIHVHVLHLGLRVETIVWIDDMSIKKSSGSARIDEASKRLALRFREDVVEAWAAHFLNKD